MTELPYDWAVSTPMGQLRRSTQRVIDLLRMHEGAQVLPQGAAVLLRDLLELDGCVTGRGANSFRDDLIAAIGGIADELAQLVLSGATG